MPVQGSAQIDTGDHMRGNAHTTDFLSSRGTGHWVHNTPAGERFRGDLDILGCHANTGNVGDFEGTGRFVGSDVDLTFLAHIEDRTRLGQPDYYSVAIFGGSTLIYSTAGEVVDGDLQVTVAP